MKKYLIVFFLIGLMLLTAACQAAPAQPTATLTAVPSTATSVPPTATPAAPVLQVTGPDGTIKSFTLDDLKALPVTAGQAGTKSSTGKITPPTAFKGVALKDLAAALGNFDNTMGINAVAKDGYSITFSYSQVISGTFTSYDPSTGDELKNPVPMTAILAYENDGKPLDPEQDGTLRLVITSQDPKQVTDGHWAVKWVTKLEIKTVEKSWSLHLEGALNELIDRATFESGAAPNCHGVTWKDDKAQEWAGISLWRLVGRVDDEIKHEDGAFNDALAKTGYAVDVVASDGYAATFTSTRIARNDNIIVAYKVNDAPLPDEYYPLRLVGSDLTKKEMVGQIAKIIVHVPALPATTTTTTPTTIVTTTTTTSGADLVVTGLVEKELTLKEADLRGMDVVKVTAEQPKKGTNTFEGVRLNALLDMAKVKPEAKKLVFTAADGYTAEIFLAEVSACPDCLVGFTTSPGKFMTVMPKIAGTFWVKDLVKIEVK
jgi:DMSO/TMAO reductase YedYZ molybdopterin-dependent catalytic subunit